MSTQTRTALITGASRGIGRAIATRLAKDGLNVVVNYQANSAAARLVVTDIITAGGRAVEVKGDVSEEADVVGMFDAAEREFGGIDVVVNSAGIMILGKVAELSLADFDQMQRVNVRGTFIVAQQAARRVRPGGAIINISTSAERQALPGYGAYAATKGAVEAMTLILARELRGREVTVNTVGPGPTSTELFLKGKSEELLTQIANFNPMERIGTPEDIAEVISFLAGPARWVNGQAVFVNGGMN